MAEINKVCDIMQAFNFQHDVQSSIGHIKDFQVGGQNLEADLKLFNPINKELESIVGAVSNVKWQGGKVQPIDIEFQVSSKNKQILSQLIHSELDNIETIFSFSVFDYDFIKKAYYESFYAEESLKGIIHKNAESLQIFINDIPDSNVLSPVNYSFSVGISPQPESQIVEISFSQTSKLAKPWGIDAA